jgi:hypothetical protein
MPDDRCRERGAERIDFGLPLRDDPNDGIAEPREVDGFAARLDPIAAVETDTVSQHEDRDVAVVADVVEMCGLGAVEERAETAAHQLQLADRARQRR